jgi:hypothetical protein
MGRALTLVMSTGGGSSTAFCAALLLASACFAQSDTVVKPAPEKAAMTAESLTAKVLPRTAGSVPLGTVVLANASALQGAPTRNAVALDQYGFVEEEYLISRSAENGRNVAYATRVLIRRPANANKFLGSVYVEPLLDGSEESPVWQAAWPYFVQRGQVWVGMTVSEDSARTLSERFDGSRYAGVVIPNDEVRWQIQADVARWIRSASGPLARPGLLARADAFEGRFKVFAAGWGPSACLQTEFINRGYHDRARRDDAPAYADVRPKGRPLIDGYVAGACPEARSIKPIADGVAVIQMMTESNYSQAAAASTVKLRQ